jgi:hypothetical protein
VTETAKKQTRTRSIGRLRMGVIALRAAVQRTELQRLGNGLTGALQLE